MFDKNNPTPPPSNLPGAEPDKNIPSPPPSAPQEAGRAAEPNRQEVKDIFASVEPKKPEVTGTGDERAEVSKIFSPDQPAPVGAPTPESKIRAAEDEIEKIKRAKSKKAPLMVVLILVLLLGIGVGAWYYFQFLSQEAVPEDGAPEQEEPAVITNINENQNINQNLNQNINQNINQNVNQNLNQNINQNINQNVNIPITRPVIIDSDFDGLSNERERALGTNINLADTDGDGLLDKEEVDIYKTNPLNPDSDGDGYSDGTEVKSGYNPAGPGRLPVPPPPGMPIE